MQDIQIFWNDNLLDYYSDKENPLPLSFNKKIDDWLNFFGNFGTTGAEFGDTLEIPATKKNCLILFGSDDPLSYSILAHIQSAAFLVNVGAFMLFNGVAELIAVNYQNNVPQSFSMRVQGSAADIWGQLQDITMNNIDMGIALSTDTAIEASWTPVTDTSNPIVWPLINYGGRMVTNNYMQTTNWDYDNSLRPAVRTWWAMKSIFAQFGYTVVGEFYNSQLFRNLIEPYINGDDWKRADNWVDFTCNVAVDAATATVADGSFIVYLDETTPPRNDIQGINSGFFAPYNSLAMLAMGGAWFEFEFYFGKATADDVTYQIELSDATFGGIEIIAQVQSNTAEGQAIYRLPPVWFSAALSSKRWVMRVRVINQSNPGNPITFNTTTYYIAKMTDRFNLGGVLSISSCYEQKPVKDWLAGVAQPFGLVYYVDSVLRRITIEPRFVRDLGQTTPTHQNDFSTTYYQLLANVAPLQSDQNGAVVNNPKPFGDDLEIFWKRDNDDPIYKLYLERLGTFYNNDTIPIYSTSIELANVNKPKKTFENAYFAPTINSRFKFTDDNPYDNNLYYPAIIENADQIKIGNLDYFTGIKPTYKGSPRLLVYYGVIDFTGVGANTNQWAYQRYDNPTVILTFNVPTCFQIYPDSADYAGQLAQTPFNLCYPTYFYSSTGDKMSGLIERYYSKYLAMVLQDKVIKVRAKMPLANYAGDNFRTPRWLQISGQMVKCWIIEVANYNPLESEFADFTLIQDIDLMQGVTEYGQTTNQQRPVLMMSNDVNILEDGTF
jgi:hypothetical protein